jgi:hypothetical protein
MAPSQVITKEIADAFEIPSKDISRTSQMFRETILGETTQANGGDGYNDASH